MLALITWGVGLALEFVLLLRALSGSFLRKYVFFYIYLGWVFSLSSVRLFIYLTKPINYRDFYWYTQPLSVLVGCGVLWEIYRQALEHYPGAARMARNVLLFSFLMVLSKALVNSRRDSVWWQAGNTAELERNMRLVQAILLIALVLVLAHYAIPLGRNLKGMILGYGFFISTSVIDLTFRILVGNSFQKWWQYLQSTSYLGVLIVWCFTLWSYETAARSKTEAKIEEDYQLLAARTRKRLLRIRSYVERAIRP